MHKQKYKEICLNMTFNKYFVSINMDYLELVQQLI